MEKNNLFKIRHSGEHVLMQAMKELGFKFHMAMGPAIDTGFYFDFELLENEISEEDFPKIEAKMQEIIDKNLPLEKKILNEDEAKKLFANNPYKIEWIEKFIEEGQELSVYYTGDPEDKNSFVDLCSGPHVDSTEQIIAFKLLSIAGAYWHGDEKNIMLTRIYGTAFETQKELDEYLVMLEEAKERDHRKLGEKLDLFTFSEIVGRGLVMYTPKGTIIKNKLKEAIVDISEKYGVQEVNIPHLAKIDLYKISGHADKFSEELFRVKSNYDEDLVLKPVNCPHHTQIYASKQRSYKELPIRYIESTQQHRDEKPGAMSGLNRTRSFEIDDGHTFCTPEQIKQEVINTLKIIEEFYSALNMWGNHWVSLSFKDPQKPEQYIGDEKDWEHAQNTLQSVSDELGLNGKVMIGEAALYGPKIDIMLKDVTGQDRQLGTVQIDFAMPKRFELTYIDINGEAKTPVMMHRAILGSYGRFIANLLESTKGSLPAWLSPTQVAIIPISDEQIDYAQSIMSTLKQDKIRTEIYQDSETMQNKIRKAQELKIPYMIIVGKKEVEASTVSIRLRDGQNINGINLEEFITKAKEINDSKSLNLW